MNLTNDDRTLLARAGYTPRDDGQWNDPLAGHPVPEATALRRARDAAAKPAAVPLDLVEAARAFVLALDVGALPGTSPATLDAWEVFCLALNRAEAQAQRVAPPECACLKVGWLSVVGECKSCGVPGPIACDACGRVWQDGQPTTLRVAPASPPNVLDEIEAAYRALCPDAVYVSQSQRVERGGKDGDGPVGIVARVEWSDSDDWRNWREAEESSLCPTRAEALGALLVFLSEKMAAEERAASDRAAALAAFRAGRK